MPVRFLCRSLAVRLDAAALDLRDRGHLGAAARLHRLAVRSAASGFAAGDAQLVRLLNNLGVVCKFTGSFDEAEAAYRRALALAEAGPTDLGLLATLLHNLAGLEHARQRPEAGEPLARRGLAIRENLVGRRHPDVAADLTALAALVDAQGRLGEAQVMYETALAILAEATEPRPLEVAVALNNLAAIAQRHGQLDEAETSYQRALAFKEQAFGRHHPELAPTLNNLALLFGATGRRPEAEATYRRALRVLAPTVGIAHPTVRTCRENLERLLDA